MSPHQQVVDAAALNAVKGSGVVPGGPVHANLHANELTAAALRRGEGRLSEDGGLVVETGVHTGRSVADKFTVDDPAISADVWWRMGNQKLPPASFTILKGRVQAYLQGVPELFTQDLYAGADPEYRLKVRLVSSEAWQTLFARNMFIRPSEEELVGFEPDYVILHAPRFHADPAIDGVRSTTAIAVSLTEKLIVVAGSEYGGEIKKSIFGVMNWVLPARGVLPCIAPPTSAAQREAGPGTWRCSSACPAPARPRCRSDPEPRAHRRRRARLGQGRRVQLRGRLLRQGRSSFRAQAEPEIFATSERFGTVMENVVHRSRLARRLDFDDESEDRKHSHRCYPIDFISNCLRDGPRRAAPSNIVMLTCRRLRRSAAHRQARSRRRRCTTSCQRLHRRRWRAPSRACHASRQATFSHLFRRTRSCRATPRGLRRACWRELIAQARHADCWLLNTGWTGGAYGVGSRMSIAHTRALLAAVLDGSLRGARYVQDPHFGLLMPQDVPGIPNAVLDPRQSWPDGGAYDKAAADLAARFEKNFATFRDGVSDEVRAVEIRAGAARVAA